MENIIFISLAAIICGAQTWNDIEGFGNKKRDWLGKFLDMTNGTPSHDTFNRFFSNMPPEQFEECFRKWVTSIIKTIKEDIVSIDGKTIRGNRTHLEDPLHVVSAWSHYNSLSLGQLKTFDKSNEITIIPELLDALYVENSIVTIDAMGCQVDIAKKIIEKQADYILAVKNNQKLLHNSLISSFSVMHPFTTHTTREDSHGRIETRTCSVIKNLRMVENPEQWKNIKTIIESRNERIIKTTGEIQSSTRYYISSLDITAEKANYCIRAHWGIENNLHWMLDIAFNEDGDKKRNKNAAMNFSLLNKMALTILKNDTTEKVGIRSRRLMAGWDDSYLLGLLKI